MTEITVILIPKSAQSLRRLRNGTRMPVTDIVNRALQLYDFIDSSQRQGYRFSRKRGSRTEEIGLL